MTGTQFNITASLKDVSSKGRSGEKFAIRVTGDDLVFDLDEKAMSAEVAEALKEQFRTNLEQGLGLDGAPLPGLAPSTEERREHEAAQGARGGQADDRYADPKFRAKAKRNYDRDYRSRLGSFTPQAGGPRGIVSGLLANSFAVRAARAGGFIVYVAARRGRPRIGETLSALESVLGNRPFAIDLERQPLLRGALQRVADTRAFTSLRDAGREAMKFLRNIRTLESQVAGLGDRD